MNLNRTQWIKG